MRVRIMTWLPAVIGFFAVSAAADEAAAQCAPAACPPPPPPCCAPPPPPTPPPAPCCNRPPAPPCCGSGGGVNVNVNVNAVSNAGATATSNAGARGVAASAARGGYFFGGGGGGSAYVTVEQPYPTALNGLNVEGWRRALVRVPYEAWRRIEKRIVIRTVCIDDRNVPHPASQVRPGRDVGLDYEGELYRCLAGSALQYTWAEWSGSEDFSQGETITCRKGEALWYGRKQFRGEGGEDAYGPGLECRPQKRERDCNERSLLRRYGAGIKVLTLIHEERYTEYREEYSEESGSVVSNATIVLDGGVGGRVF